MDLTNFGVKKNKEDINSNNKDLEISIDKIKEDIKSKELEYFLPWFLKYQINNINDIPETDEIIKIKDFFEGRSKKNSILLVGQAGSGKTSTLTFFANYYNMEIFEINASDSRNKKSINEILSDVLFQKSLFNQEKLILIDEVDGVSSTKDRGGVNEIIKFIKKSPYKIVFTANDPDSNSVKSLKKVSEIINFEKHSFDLLKKIGIKILKSEKIIFDKVELENFIIERDNPDIRGFINDLQGNVLNGEFHPSENLEIRSYKKRIDVLLSKIFYSNPEDSYKSYFNSDILIDDLFLYLEENIPQVYRDLSLKSAMNEFSKADVFRGRIRKWQYWRFLLYCSFYLTYGISNSKNYNGIISFNKWKKNSRILKKWILGNKLSFLKPRTKIQKEKGLEENLIEKLANIYGTSTKKFLSESLPYFLINYKNDNIFRDKINKELNIDEKTQKSLIELR